MAGLEAHYSARDIEARILAALRAAGLNPEQRLSPEELGALDHFHTGGLRASSRVVGTPSRRWPLGKRLRPIFRFRGPPTLLKASLSVPKRFARFSARVDSSLNSSRIPATLI